MYNQPKRICYGVKKPTIIQSLRCTNGAPRIHQRN
ncbi:MAG TPA: hypothetical protein DD827_08050 [Gammaproteobacteria bacterium]|nr:hypothetical protein [Gammaproteobacteria bacterium]